MKRIKTIAALSILSFATISNISFAMRGCGCSLHEQNSIAAAEKRARKEELRRLARLQEQRQSETRKRQQSAQKKAMRREKATRALSKPLEIPYDHFIFQTRSTQRETEIVLTKALLKLPSTSYKFISQYTQDDFLTMLKFKTPRDMLAMRGTINLEVLKKFQDHNLNADTKTLDPNAPLPDEIQSIIRPYITICEKIKRAKREYRRANARDNQKTQASGWFDSLCSVQ